MLAFGADMLFKRKPGTLLEAMKEIPGQPTPSPFEHPFDLQNFAFQAEAFHDFSSAMQIDLLNRAIVPGSGVDVRDLQADKSLAFMLSTYPPPQQSSGSLKVEYYHSASDVVTSVGGGSNLEASLITSYFSIGGSFKSSSMRQNEQQKSSGYIVLKFDPQYNFVEIANETLNPSAKQLFQQEGIKAFYEKYGTHFVSAAQPHALYAVIYTFHADSASSLQSFEQDIGINLGIGNVFGVGFGNKVQQALSSKSRQVSFSFQEYYASSAGVMPLPPLANVGGTAPPDAFYLMDPANVTSRYNTFLAQLATATIPYTQIKLRPFAELLDPAMAGNIPTERIVLATSVYSDVSDLLSDYNTMLQAPGVWSSGPSAAQAGDLSDAQHAVNVAILNVLSEPKPANQQKLKEATDHAAQLGDAFFKNPALWPAESAVQLKSCSQSAPFSLELNFKSDKRLGKPTVRAVGNSANSQSTVVDLIKDSEVT